MYQVALSVGSTMLGFCLGALARRWIAGWIFPLALALSAVGIFWWSIRLGEQTGASGVHPQALQAMNIASVAMVLSFAAASASGWMFTRTTWIALLISCGVWLIAAAISAYLLLSMTCAWTGGCL